MIQILGTPGIDGKKEELMMHGSPHCTSYSYAGLQYVVHDQSQIECNLKVKSEISACTAIMLNDHSNPYIESTTVHSDSIRGKYSEKRT